MRKFIGQNIWHPNELSHSQEHWCLQLPESIKKWLLKHKEIDKKITDINSDDLSFSKNCDQLKSQVLDQLENKHGFMIIKGLAEVCNTMHEYEKVLWILGLLIGNALPQSKEGDGDYIHEVKNRNYDKNDPRYRGTTGTDAICFHNDACDVGALLCINNAKCGGENKIVSSGMINNYMYDNHPNLLEELYNEYPFYQNIVINTTPKPVHFRPIIAEVNNKIVCTTIRALIDKTQIYEDAKMTQNQIEALDVLEELAHKFSYEFIMEKGDLFLFNNFITLHSRKGFVDNPSPFNRLLLRLWLNVENSRDIHPSYEESYGSIKGGTNRGGSR